MNLFEDALDSTYRFIAKRQKTEYEVKRYLKKKGYDEETAGKVLTILKEKKYIDDEGFTKKYVENKKEKFGIFQLKRKLRDLGIDEETIEENIGAIPREDSYRQALMIIEKKMDQYFDLDPEKAARRCYSLLVGRGFEAEIASRISLKVLKEVKDRRGK